MVQETGSCEACDKPISTEASRCPECGNNPSKKAKWSAVGIMLIGVLMMWMPIVGIPIFLIGLLSRVGVYLQDFPPTEYDFG